MQFPDEIRHLIEEKVSKLKEYASYDTTSKKPPLGYSDCLTFRLSIVPQFDIEPILNELLIDGKNGLGQTLKKLRDKALTKINSYNKKCKPEHFIHLPDSILQNDVLALAVALEMILSKEQQIKKKVDGVMKHPALKPFVDDKIMKVIFGDIEWPTEFDKYIIENPTNEDELVVSQYAYLAKVTAYILIRLKRWLEMGAEKEVKQFYHTYINPFDFQMSAINIPCQNILDVLPVRLPNLEQRFREQYLKMLSVAEKADKKRVSQLGECINNFKLTTRDFHRTVFMIHSEALAELNKLTKLLSDDTVDMNPIKVEGRWRGKSFKMLRNIDSDSTRKGIKGNKSDLKNLKDWLTRHQKRPDIAETLELKDGRIKTRLPYRSIFIEPTE